MHLLDLIYEFEAKFQYIDNSECYEFTVDRNTYDTVRATETYLLTVHDLDDLQLGLKTMYEKLLQFRKNLIQ